MLERVRKTDRMVLSCIGYYETFISIFKGDPMHYNWNSLAYLPTAPAVQNTAVQTPYDYRNQGWGPISQISTPDQTLAPGHEIYSYPHNLDGALQLIRQAVTGENEDRIFYQYLIDNAPTEEEKEIIRGIRENEITHFGLFRQIYSQLTGRMLPVPEEVPAEPPASYCEGLKKALIGEQNAVEKYRRILYAMQNRIHINMLTEIITDEIRHGILYNYLYSKNNCKA